MINETVKNLAGFMAILDFDPSMNDEEVKELERQQPAQRLLTLSAKILELAETRKIVRNDNDSGFQTMREQRAESIF